VQPALVKILCDAGARVNGRDDDDSPLWTAIIFGYPAAVEMRARCGARVDNLVTAAAVGDLGAVSRMLADPESSVSHNGQMTLSGPPKPLPTAPEDLRDLALIYASAMGRVDVVKLLVDRGARLDVREPWWNATALGMARYHKRQKVIAYLEACESAEH